MTSEEDGLGETGVKPAPRLVIKALGRGQGVQRGRLALRGDARLRHTRRAYLTAEQAVKSCCTLGRCFSTFYGMKNTNKF